MIARSSTSKCQCTKRKEILLSKTLSKHNTLMSSLVFSALKKNLKNSNFNNNNTIAPQVNLCVRCCCSQLTEKLSVGRRKRQTCTSSRRECRAAATARLRTKHSHVLPKILKLWSKYVKTENSTKYAFV